MRAADVLLQKLKGAQVRPADMAKALAISRPLASMMLSGKRGIPTWHLDAVAALLKVSVPELFIDHRAEAAHPKKSLGVTPGTGGDVQGATHSRGGPLDATTANRSLSESEALRRLRIYKQLYDAADAVRAATDALGGHLDPTVPSELAEHPKSDAYVSGRSKPRRRAR